MLTTAPRRGYLKDGDLATGREQGQGDTLVVGAEAVALARRGEAEPPQVGEVGVAVQHPALCVPEAGAGPWRRQGTGERPGPSLRHSPSQGTPSLARHPLTQNALQRLLAGAAGEATGGAGAG